MYYFWCTVDSWESCLFLKNFRALFVVLCVIIFETLFIVILRIFGLLCDYIYESFCILSRILLYLYCIILWCISCGLSRFILIDLNLLVYLVILRDTLHGVKRGGGVQVKLPLLKLTVRVSHARVHQ